MDRGARLILAALALAGCAPLSADYGGLRIEQRPAESIVRISNSGPRAVTIYYNVEPNFNNYQMLLVRFRDGASRVIGDDEYARGWWSPLDLSSNLYRPNERVPRRALRIPAGGGIEIPRDIAALTIRRHVSEVARGPCEVQIMLLGFPGMREGQRRIEVVSEWQPAACPEPEQLPPGFRPK